MSVDVQSLDSETDFTQLSTSEYFLQHTNTICGSFLQGNQGKMHAAGENRNLLLISFCLFVFPLSF